MRDLVGKCWNDYNTSVYSMEIGYEDAGSEERENIALE